MNYTKDTLQIHVSESIGNVSAILQAPPDPTAILVLAHGGGAGMNHAFMEALALELITQNLAVMRFNFPYMEAKKRRPDFPAVAEKTSGAVVTKVSALLPGLPLYASGKSYGSRMISQFLSKNNSGKVSGIVFFGFPLHPAGKPSTDRAKHLFDIEIPMLFHQGTRDALAETKLIKGLCEQFAHASLIEYQGADHSFGFPKKNITPEMADHTSAWIRKQLVNG